MIIIFSTPSSSLLEAKRRRGRPSETAYIKVRSSLAIPPEAIIIKLLQSTESSKNEIHIWNKFIKKKCLLIKTATVIAWQMENTAPINKVPAVNKPATPRSRLISLFPPSNSFLTFYGIIMTRSRRFYRAVYQGPPTLQTEGRGLGHLCQVSSTGTCSHFFAQESQLQDFPPLQPV